MYIQPCCIDNELPPVIRQGFAFFQSNGDWKATQLMSAVSCLVPESVCVLMTPEADMFLLRELARYVAKGWYTGVLLLTADNQKEAVKEAFGKYIDRVQYACDKQVSDGLFALTNGCEHMVIQGPLLNESDFSLCNYAASFGKSDSLFYSAIEASLPKLKLGALIKADHEAVKAIMTHNAGRV